MCTCASLVYKSLVLVQIDWHAYLNAVVGVVELVSLFVRVDQWVHVLKLVDGVSNVVDVNFADGKVFHALSWSQESNK